MLQHQTVDKPGPGLCGLSSAPARRYRRFTGSGWISVADSLFFSVLNRWVAYLAGPVGIERLAQHPGHDAVRGNHALYRLETRPVPARNDFTQS